MTDIRIEGGTLTANRETRVVTGLLVPYGEAGRTNLGYVPKGVRPHALKIPKDFAHLNGNDGHDRERPLSVFAGLTDTEHGVYVALKVTSEPEGDALLADIANGKRNRLSVEARNIVISDGEIVAGEVFGAGHVDAGAFPSAALFASDVGTEPAPTAAPATAEPMKGNAMADPTEAPASTIAGTFTGEVTPAPAGTLTASAPSAPTPAPTGTLTASAAPVPATPVSPFTPAATPLVRTGASLADVSRAVSLFASRNDRRALDSLEPSDRSVTLFGALNDIGLSDVEASYVPQWLGEVWDKRQYERRLVPLLSHDTLTSPKQLGYKWTTPPEGGAYAGDKANVPSNTPVIDPVEEPAERWAMGHDIDRAVVDFGMTEWFAGYARLGATDYARYSDARALAKIIAEGTTVEAGNPGDALPVFGQIVDGALAVIESENTPTFAAVSLSAWRTLALANGDAVKTALAWSLGLEGGELDGFRILPMTGVPSGNVVVGAGQAATFSELPGSPIRTVALDQIRAGVDEAMFGYFATLVANPAAFQIVTPYVP